MITEKKDVFKIQLLVEVASINLDNINVKFNSITMSNEDEEDEIVFKDRQWDLSKERCSDGVNIYLYIVNDGTEVQDRMDYLVGEEYLISKVDAEISLESTGESLEYKVVDPYGEQTTRDMKVEVSETLETVTNYLVDRLTEGNQGLKDVIFEIIKEDEYVQDIFEQIIKIPVF